MVSSVILVFSGDGMNARAGRTFIEYEASEDILHNIAAEEYPVKAWREVHSRTLKDIPFLDVFPEGHAFGTFRFLEADGLGADGRPVNPRNFSAKHIVAERVMPLEEFVQMYTPVHGWMREATEELRRNFGERAARDYSAGVAGKNLVHVLRVLDAARQCGATHVAEIGGAWPEMMVAAPGLVFVDKGLNVLHAQPLAQSPAPSSPPPAAAMG